MPFEHVTRFALTVSWILTSAVRLSFVRDSPPRRADPMDSVRLAQLQYGYHISSLNSSSSSLICSASSIPPSRKGLFSLPTCLDMTDSAFGLITSAYTVGGLGGSLNAGGMIERWGKKGTAVRSAGVIVLGALAVSLGSYVWVLVVGRILIGVSCGIATVLVPLYLSSVAPPAIAGSIGILTQISINVGIFAAQGFSIPLSTPGTGQWRLVSLISAGLAVAQILTGPLVPESRGKEEKVHDSDTDEERAPLAADEGEDDSDSLNPRRKVDSEKSLSVAEVLQSRNPAVKKAMWTLVATMVFQQFSGINAVMYYSTSILTAVNPTSAKTVSLLVTLVNLIMTFPAIFLIDRLGRRTLLLTSLALMCASTALLGWSIDNHYFRIASGGIMAFVVSFALGLGPVPFVLVGEMPPREAKSATASIAVAVNWISNLTIGLLFLPLRDYLAHRTAGGGGEDGEGSGTVFYIFTAWTGLGVLVLARLMR
ncbi:Bifunctional purine biosynthesis protein PurH [Rhodotorula toruloides]